MVRHPERASVRVAIVHAPNIMLALVTDHVRCFKSTQLDDATEWLLGEN